jgi:hypothetical protein
MFRRIGMIVYTIMFTCRHYFSLLYPQDSLRRCLPPLVVAHDLLTEQRPTEYNGWLSAVYELRNRKSE